MAELVREKLLAIARDELPHSIVVTAEPLEEDDDERRREEDDGDEDGEGSCATGSVVRVERDSQKGIVIGKGGAVIRDAGTKARHELETLLGARVYLETRSGWTPTGSAGPTPSTGSVSDAGRLRLDLATSCRSRIGRG